MRRIFHLVFGALAMLAVALLSAFLSMRLAIHGREVKVPDLSKLSLADAGRLAASRGLRLSLEDRFYSATVPAGRVLAQSPAPGVKVRREWAVRITESLGPQQASIPNVVGQAERPASIVLRRIGLETGTIAHLPSDGAPGLLLAQTPLPGAEDIERPSVSFLLSDPQPLQPSQAIVMPALNGLTLPAASARAAAAGLHIVSAEDIVTSPQTAPSSPPTNQSVPQSTATAPTLPSALINSQTAATVVAQSPAAGYRISRGAAVRVTLAH